jgi:OHCU decarboxylase
MAVTLEGLNAADRDAFVAALDGLYEHSPWIPERAWPRRPFADIRALELAMRDVVLQATRAEQLDLINRHPRLGARAPLTMRSQAEQRGAGIERSTNETRDELAELNARYEQRFGFPFIVAVKNLGVRDIIENCRERLANDPATEFEESLRQIFRIAGFRLADTLR